MVIQNEERKHPDNVILLATCRKLATLAMLEWLVSYQRNGGGAALPRTTSLVSSKREPECTS
jgi:hypothetical protein